MRGTRRTWPAPHGRLPASLLPPPRTHLLSSACLPQPTAGIALFAERRMSRATGCCGTRSRRPRGSVRGAGPSQLWTVCAPMRCRRDESAVLAASTGECGSPSFAREAPCRCRCAGRLEPHVGRLPISKLIFMQVCGCVGANVGVAPCAAPGSECVCQRTCNAHTPAAPTLLPPQSEQRIAALRPAAEQQFAGRASLTTAIPGMLEVGGRMCRVAAWRHAAAAQSPAAARGRALGLAAAPFAAASHRLAAHAISANRCCRWAHQRASGSAGCSTA